LIPGHKYILKHYGKKGMEKVTEHMAQNDAAPIKEKLLAGKWYPYRTFIGLLRASDDIFGKGDNSFIVDMGSLCVKEGLSTIYKVFIKLGNPNQTLAKMGKTWHLSFEPGTLAMLKNEPGHAVVRLSDWPEPRKEFCMAQAGGMKGALELAGASDVVVKEPRCACLGDKYCEWNITWK
jgi:predicted hydrocarbon binding protein